MPKQKTHKGAAKRFNLTKTGKVKRAQASYSDQEAHQAYPQPSQGGLSDHHRRTHHEETDSVQVRRRINNGKSEACS